MTISNLLINLLLGAVLGIVGQGIRLIVGLKKCADEEQKSFSEVLDNKKMVSGLLISLVVGAIAGFLGMIMFYDNNLVPSKQLIISLISIGYAGTDFIQGLLGSNSKKNNPPAG